MLVFNPLASYEEKYQSIGIDFVTPICPKTNPISITTDEEKKGFIIDVHVGDDACTTWVKVASILILMLIRYYLSNVLNRYAN